MRLSLDRVRLPLTTCLGHSKIPLLNPFQNTLTQCNRDKEPGARCPFTNITVSLATMLLRLSSAVHRTRLTVRSVAISTLTGNLVFLLPVTRCDHYHRASAQKVACPNSVLAGSPNAAAEAAVAINALRVYLGCRARSLSSPDALATIQKPATLTWVECVSEAFLDHVLVMR